MCGVGVKGWGGNWFGLERGRDGSGGVQAEEELVGLGTGGEVRVGSRSLDEVHNV